jgi:S-DNA-T family DNA segregation ATPase FtsK/SpoIIIE
MASKAHAESYDRDRGRSGRRREIRGICLLALGLFATLSLFSMHTGDNRMMGPGGAAAAGALYTLAGAAAYLLATGLLVAAWRSFRGQPLVQGVAEGLGGPLLLASVTVLLHLPTSGEARLLRGPGGLVGEWLGEVSTSFIGAVGTGLGAVAALFVALLLVTEIQFREVVAVVAWMARNATAGAGVALSAGGRLIAAMFPRRDEGAADDEPAGATASREVVDDLDEAELPRLHAAHTPAPVEVEWPSAGEEAAAPRLDGAENTDVTDVTDDAVLVGRAHPLEVSASVRVEPRSAMADVVAEVAAVERVPAEEADAEPHVIDERPAEPDAATAPTILAPAAPAPIIVEPAWRAKLREQERAAERERALADGDGGAEARSETRASDADADTDADGDDGLGFIRLKDGAYQLPATELLEYSPPQGSDMDKQALYDMAERLEQAMANYGVRGQVKEIHMGPVVTMYEFAPAPGTRTGKIANLEKDLAMALEAQAVRIVAPIPGKAVVGVEVPNRSREMVYLREILEDDCFTKATSKLQVALGKDIKGAPVSVNLAKMPHLLVAGTTGSGKSVAVNGMIVSLLYNASPEDVRFIMVDPKMLELSIYEGIPHLLLPVVTDPKKANLALRWAVEEMERRYELMAKAGVRDITGYNVKVEAGRPGAGAGAGAGAGTVVAAAPTAARAAVPGRKRLKVVIAAPDGTEQEVEMEPDTEVSALPEAAAAAAAAAAVSDGAVTEPMDPEAVSAAAAARQAEAQAAGPLPKKLPYVVIVIDEFADLMMVAPKDVETSVARIAQKARAAGLHLILATQRPSVDVITGLIKANFPSRIALQVASKIDSRTILDQPGADTLLGNGDMLFSDRGTKLRRVHGAFLGDGEVHRVVEHLKSQAKPVYDMDILKPRDEDAEEGGTPADDFHDDLYDQAVAIVCETRQASVSYIQRRLQIGYNRSARMVEQMERDGVVGPANGAKPRDVLAPPGEYLQQAG